MVAADGGLFAFGTATFKGSLAGTAVPGGQVVGITATGG
jgi:hypothetical protein